MFNYIKLKIKNWFYKSKDDIIIPNYDRDIVIDQMCKLSDNALDAMIKPRLQALRGRPDIEIKDELLGIIDDCVAGSLTSDLMIYCLRKMWERCGGTKEEIIERNYLLKDENNINKLKLKYKWECADHLL